MHELRQDPLANRWVVVTSDHSAPPSYYFADRRKALPRPAPCMLCSGPELERRHHILAIPDPERPAGEPAVRVIAREHPLFQIEGELDRHAVGLYDAMNGIGANEIVIESPRHEVLPESLGLAHMALLVWTWRQRVEDLQKDSRFRHILIFKNFGQPAGAEFDHPYSEIVAMPVTPKAVREELFSARGYFLNKDRCIFCDMAREELRRAFRIVHENRDFVAFVPYAPRMPFEIHVLPKRHQCSFVTMTWGEADLLAEMLMICKDRIRRVLDDPPYNLVLHSAPNKTPRRGYWETLEEDYHWHIELVPRVVQMSGFEWGSGLQVLPTAPEHAAEYLRKG